MSTQPLVDAFYDELNTVARERQAVVIMTSAAEHAMTSISRGRPGYAHYQLERARLRAQAVLDGTVPTGDGGAR